MARTSRPTSCSWTRAPRRRPPWSPRAASSSRRRFPCSSGHPSRPSAAACRAPRWPPRSRTARCASDRGTPTVGRPRPLPKWACPFAPKANTLGPAPGEERAFVESHPGTGAGFFSTPFLSSLAAGSREAARDGDSAPPGGGSASRGTAGSDPRESAPRERGERVRVGRRRDGRAVGPVPGPRDFRIDLATKGTAGWRTRRKRRRARPDGVLASAPTRRHPGWNVGVLAAFAARRRAAAETARKKKRAARDGSGPSGSGSGSAERRKREPNIQTFFSPAA